MTRSVESAQDLNEYRRLRLDTLLPGQFTTGVPLSEARKFAEEVSEERGNPIILSIVRNGENKFVWVVKWKVEPFFMGDWNLKPWEDHFLITDEIRGVENWESPHSKRIIFTLGEYILVIPYSQPGSIQLDIYPHNHT